MSTLGAGAAAASGTAAPPSDPAAASAAAGASWVYSELSVPTMISLAKRPVKRPTVAGQLSFSIPIGVKTGVIARPVAERIDCSLSSLPKLPSVPTLLITLRSMTTRTMTVPARIMKDFKRLQV